MTEVGTFALHDEANDSGTCVIVVEGEADMSSAVKFNESFFAAVRHGTRRVLVDLSGVRFIDTSMLNALVVGHRRMVRDRGRFAVVCNGARVQRVLDVTGLAQILTVYESREGALAHLSDRL